MICMKKLLAICSIFFTVCAALTGCGDNNDGHYSDNGNGVVTEYGTTDKRYETTAEKRTDSVKDRVEDAADGIGDAGKDIIGGAQNAADDIIDGMDGEKESEAMTTITDHR